MPGIVSKQHWKVKLQLEIITTNWSKNGTHHSRNPLGTIAPGKLNHRFLILATAMLPAPPSRPQLAEHGPALKGLRWCLPWPLSEAGWIGQKYSEHFSIKNKRGFALSEWGRRFYSCQVRLPGFLFREIRVIASPSVGFAAGVNLIPNKGYSLWPKQLLVEKRNVNLMLGNF